MKKFFTLCLMFFAVGVLNLSAGYVLSGENVNGEAWNHSSATNTFTADENGDLVLKGVSLSGEFLVTKDQSSWYKPIYGAQLTAGVPVIMTTDNSDNCKCATSYTNCTIKLTEISNAAVAIEIISTDTADVEITSIGESWGLIGDFNSWASDITLTKKEYGVYEAWLDQATVESIISGGFKFRADAAWNADFGATDLGCNFNEWNILFRGSSTNIQMTQPAETYDKYLLTLCVEGSSAKFRIDGYNEAAVSNLQSSTITLTADAQGYTNGQAVTSVTDANGVITATFDQGTGGTAPAYYSTGDAVRVYYGGNLTISAPLGKIVTGVKFTFGSGDKTNVISANSGTYTEPQWTGEAQEVKFSVDGTSGHRRIQAIEVTYGEIPTFGPVFEGVENNGHYYNSVMYNINATGADKMYVKMLKDGALFWETTTTYFPFSNGGEPGEWEITATTYKGNEYITSTVAFTVEAVESVYSLSEFVGTTGKKQYKYNTIYVLAQSGNNLYVKDNSRSMLIYGSAPTFKAGDYFQELIAEYKEYNGIHELIPVQFGQVYGNSPQDPEELTIDQVTAENQSKFVKLTGLTLALAEDGESYTLDGVAVYNRFNTELPTDLTKKYDVTAIVGMYSGVVQLEPLSFTESDPNTYTVTFTADPADGSTLYTALETISLIPSVTVAMPTTEGQTANWCTVTDANGNTYNSQIGLQSGSSYYALTIEGATALGTYTVKVPAKTFVDALTMNSDAKNYNASFTLTYTIAENPLKLDLIPYATTPANNAEVESLTKVTLFFPEDAVPYDQNWFTEETPLVTDQDGNIYTAEIVASDWTDIYYININGVTNPGTYTLTIPEGQFGSEDYFGKEPYYTIGHANPELTYTFTLKAPALEVASVTPENGTSVACLNTVTLTFAESVTENAEAGEITCVGTVKDPGYNKADVTVSVDGATVTFALAETSDYWYAGETYQLTIPAGYFTGTSGKTNEALTYSWTISEEASYTLTPVTVEPASGNTVESLSEIYLTFDEPVKNYYSAGKASLKDADGNEVATGSYSRYDATGTFNKYMIKVTLSAAVTAAGEYTLTIPQGALGDYTADYYFYNKGCVNPELTYNYTIGVAGPEEGFSYESITPDPEETASLSSIESVVVTFPADVTYDGSLVMIGTTAMTAKGTLTVTVEGNTVTFTPSAPITAVGTHQLTWNAGAFTAANGAKCAKATINYTVAEADPNKYDYVLTADPADGSTLPALTSITLSDATGSGLPYLTTEAQNTQNWVVVSDADGNIYSATLANTTGITITVEGATAPGTYTVFIPEKTYYDLKYSQISPYRYNPDMTLTYTVEEATTDNQTFVPTAVSPASGETVTELTEVTLTFPGGWLDFVGEARFNHTSTMVDANGVSYGVNLGYHDDYDKVKVSFTDADGYETTITAAGTYTLTIPAMVVGDQAYINSNGESGIVNPELVYTWTIAEPQPATFVPEVTPAAGDVTVDELKHTVITLPAAWASFDNSIDYYYDQIYINVERTSYTSQIWVNYAATITKSEDLKTIDIVWDFAPEDGAKYTLVIPAGNIVLEDGSINERVEVPYNIVEKKNDFAEFTVPAGYMGWLGYNETDANYWAPEFPFTVSTTANSTLVFTAELPSLPVGWVNMEVWDNDNNALIATMTQTATATVADGEVYTVTGETTKEYVDGTTLNFRFRVPRAAGVSETITFQYVVGGGTITGADEIELDGNVAVRGNNIYAPEGAGIYTVSGLAVSGENLEPGVYVVVLGKQVVKVMVK